MHDPPVSHRVISDDKEETMTRKVQWLLSLVIVIALAACQPGSGSPVEPSPTQGGGEPVESPLGPQTPLAPDPQPITFQAPDGQELHGLYYPAAANPAPLVILMHWVAGDMSDWYEIAPWLQNRGLANPFPNPANRDWWDPFWFPPAPSGVSYGVFIFSLRGCSPGPQGCPTWTPPEWLLDVQAAMFTAAQLEGVDPARIATVGASIGGDGAIDGCIFLNEQMPGSCRGAASLSPGGYLNTPYPEAVTTLTQQQPPSSAWCLVDPNNQYDVPACSNISAAQYRRLDFPDGGHGMSLFRQEVSPSAMQALLDFLAETLGP